MLQYKGRLHKLYRKLLYFLCEFNEKHQQASIKHLHLFLNSYFKSGHTTQQRYGQNIFLLIVGCWSIIV